MIAMDQGLHAVDQVYIEYLKANPNLSDRWLFEQMMHMSAQRRSFIESLPIQEDWKVLDVGTGFGALPVELAKLKHVEAIGVDVDREKLQIAKTIAEHLNDEGIFDWQGTVDYFEQDACTLDFANETFDMTFAWFVFQHLTKPSEVLDELYRTTKQGGYVCLVDTDDQFSMYYPEIDGYRALQTVYGQVQSLSGDRNVGRKLPSLLQNAGFTVLNTIVQSNAVFGAGELLNAERSFMSRHFLSKKDDIIGRGWMSELDFEKHLRTFLKNDEIPRFRTNSQVIVMAQKL